MSSRVSNWPSGPASRKSQTKSRPVALIRIFPAGNSNRVVGGFGVYNIGDGTGDEAVVETSDDAGDERRPSLGSQTEIAATTSSDPVTASSTFATMRFPASVDIQFPLTFVPRKKNSPEAKSGGVVAVLSNAKLVLWLGSAITLSLGSAIPAVRGSKYRGAAANSLRTWNDPARRSSTDKSRRAVSCRVRSGSN